MIIQRPDRNMDILAQTLRMKACRGSCMVGLLVLIQEKKLSLNPAIIINITYKNNVVRERRDDHSSTDMMKMPRATPNYVDGPWAIHIIRGDGPERIKKKRRKIGPSPTDWLTGCRLECATLFDTA